MSCPSRTHPLIQRSFSLSSIFSISHHSLGEVLPGRSHWSDQSSPLQSLAAEQKTYNLQELLPPSKVGCRYSRKNSQALLNPDLAAAQVSSKAIITGSFSDWTSSSSSSSGSGSSSMSYQVAEQKTCEVTDHQGDSEESDEDNCTRDLLATSWDDLSILERLGLSSLQMTEVEAETAFAQLSLAFKCDQYTLKKRLQVEERARDVAEENIKRELEAGCTILKTLKSLCPDKKRLEVLQQLELSLQILSNAIGRITCTAELLGAVHQEARMSRAVELMVVHVENLKRRHAKEHTELEETKRLVQRNVHSRKLSDSRDESETRQKLQRPSLQHPVRRRVSIAVIPKHLQSQSSEAKIVDSGKIKDGLESLEVTKDVSQDCSRFPLHSSTKDSHANCSQMPLIFSLSPSQQVVSSDSQDEDDDKCVNRWSYSQKLLPSLFCRQAQCRQLLLWVLIGMASCVLLVAFFSWLYPCIGFIG
ncbi:inositol 1,4,5-triphosphate receptor associated 2 isoform X2 [Erpetoichthys calabaricus]|uniref:inositol 1,4,5-triphosphate receptor associated 2 isoform X2 n=1 Tax=Erpetoichthys calabaricus TaxID=27687 RepID=UPI0022341782|nr:inositol 1,4,5-triphosphate receptor associated 2 isoform X2 [Erpetoichthys calabaricus]